MEDKTNAPWGLVGKLEGKKHLADLGVVYLRGDRLGYALYLFANVMNN
jgi:hypothetical protein